MTRLSYRTSPVEHVVLRDGVVVVAVDDEQRVALIRHTAPLHGEMLSVPGGMVEEGETSRAAAERELAEETGLSAADWERVGEFVPVPYSTQRLSIFLATGLVCGTPHLEAHEIDAGFRLEWWPLVDALGRVRDGEVRLSGSALALLLVTERLGQVAS
ncbi:NUDIX domain-containing protein [Cellulomonas sp. P22]|uniref:NUDIX domain-containing protein n=1 Tax=Cellulomonas sp. P22 TaxID=3373189 RepID=UPI003798CBA7